VVRAEVWRALSSSVNLLARLSEEKEWVLNQNGEDSPGLGHCTSLCKFWHLKNISHFCMNWKKLPRCSNVLCCVYL
jgi:hypothetical protein